MKIQEVFELLIDKGLKARRSVWKDTRWVEARCPSVCPDGDGPSTVFVVRRLGRPISSPFDTEAEAKAELASMKKSLAAKWAQFKKDTDKFAEASQADIDSGAVRAGIRPGIERDYYKSCDIQGQPASRLYRINKPYLVGMTKAGEVLPWLPSMEDMFATDWEQA